MVWLFLVPQLHDVESSVAALRRLSPLLVAASALLQLLSLLSVTVLSVAVLGFGRLPFFHLLRIDLADLAINHSLPGGGATASAVHFRLLTVAGVPAARAISASAVQVLGSTVVLGLLFLLGVALSFGSLQERSEYLTAGVVVGVVVLAAALFGVGLLHHWQTIAALASRLGSRIPLLGAERPARLVTTLADMIRELAADHRRLALAVLAAAANWLFDAASLWAMLAAGGNVLPPGSVLAVYGVGGVLAMLPITPGGVGIVEGVLTPAITALGVPGSEALVAVLGWRVFEFWLPIPVGLLAYLSLTARSRRVHRR